MAHPTDDRRGYILDVYVEPGYRGRGVAKNLMHEAELSFRRQGVNYVFLHASDAGRPLYESLGFAPTTEMAITLPAWDA
jgi:ribosomal protein S18 acetylase RimI-like enzyme